MRAIIYAVETPSGWQWRPSLDFEVDQAYWRQRCGSRLRILAMASPVSWGQAMRMAEEWNRDLHWAEKLYRLCRETGEYSQDAHLFWNRSGTIEQTVWREMRERLRTCGIPEGVTGVPFYTMEGNGKQPFLEEATVLHDPDVRRTAELMRGRSLLRDELLSLLTAAGIDRAEERWAALVQAAVLQGWLRVRGGVERAGKVGGSGLGAGGRLRLFRLLRTNIGKDLIGRLKGTARFTASFERVCSALWMRLTLPGQRAGGVGVNLEGREASGRARAGVDLRAAGDGYQCRRCGAQGTALRFTDCPHCGGPCPYCERCLGMGRSRFCAPLIEGVAEMSDGARQGRAGGSGRQSSAHTARTRVAGPRLTRAAHDRPTAPFTMSGTGGLAVGSGGWPSRGADDRPTAPLRAASGATRQTDAAALTARWGLSPAQADASASALAFLRRTDPAASAHEVVGSRFDTAADVSRRFLLWAVTGAGKTEMIFPLIEHEVTAGRRVLLAAPRRDVVLELLPRVRKAFPNVDVVALYGGSEQRWESGRITLATTHQLLRFREAFDLAVIDELDAFPYHNNPMLQYAAEKSIAPGGRRIFLSATPPAGVQREAALGLLPHAKVPVRYHRHPLPVPWLMHSKSTTSCLKSDGLPRPLRRVIQASLARGAQLFVFVPQIALVDPFVRLLQSGFVQYVIEGTSSQDRGRAEKVTGFRQGRIDVLVTTTILERGVTVPKTDVLVLDADSPLFDEASLVQMAGRAGRSKDDPKGRVTFAAAALTRSQAGAVRQIRQMNRIAKAKGYLITRDDRAGQVGSR